MEEGRNDRGEVGSGEIVIDVDTIWCCGTKEAEEEILLRCIYFSSTLLGDTDHGPRRQAQRRGFRLRLAYIQ